MVERRVVAREQEQSEADATMESLIGLLLMGGVLLSMVLTVSGLIWHWLNTRELGLDYLLADTNLFHFLVQDLRQLFSDEIRPRLLVNLGIAALLLTPYFRVFASMVFFAFVERNWKYTLFTALVFSVLSYSLFLR
jgi:uncharacterized membrane protein